MLCLAGMFLYTNPVLATPFPDKTEHVIQDEDNYLEDTDKTSLTESLSGLPGTYKIVVVESTSPEAATPDEYAQKLYDNYNLSDDALMVVLDMNTEQLGVYAGAELQEKGATMEMLHDKIASYYEPFRNEKQYLNGIETFIIETNAELNRLGTQQATASAEAAQDSAETAEEESSSLLGGIPWWVYAIGGVFAGLSILLIYAMIRRRSIFTQVDDVEDWKDELVGKIQEIEVEKPLRRASGKTEVRYHHLADKKENLLRIRIPDVEMMILDAEEACDRFRFSLATGILGEAQDLLEEIEKELAELQTDTTQVAVAKQENKVPEIGKQVEQVERRLSDMRLEYGLSFHEMKAALDEVETMRSLVKTARSAGDDVHAYETALKAQQKLEELTKSLDLVPKLVDRVKRELPKEFKQLEEGIEQAVRDGFDLGLDGLDKALLQAKQLLNAAANALEEGNVETVNTHVKAFEVLVENTYQGLEATILAKRQAAAVATERQAAVVATAPEIVPPPLGETAVPAEQQPLAQEQTHFLEKHPSVDEVFEEADETLPKAVHVVEEEASLSLQNQGESEHQEEAIVYPPSGRHESQKQPEWLQTEETEEEPDRDEDMPAEALTQAERDVLLRGKGEKTVPQAADLDEREESIAEDEPDDDEYELVIPKKMETLQAEYEEEEPQRLVIETEDDALDELERISNTLVRLRQEIKRSYLPGIPDQLKYMFEEVVLTLARIKTIMEQYRYDLEEVAILVQDASDQLAETEEMTERIISTCKMAEGAIQYTNRYRRQNRQVNELLNKAEQSFRQLSFAEAYQLAEEARLVIEDAPQETETSGWLLRRKKKG